MSLFANVAALSAPNDPLVSQDDFTEWFSLSNVTTAQAARIQTALEIASADCRSETNQQLSVSSDSVTINQRCGSGEIILPQWPVTAITSVVIDGNMLTENTDYVWSNTGVVSPVLRSAMFWSWREWRQVVVSYTHGWSPMPRDIAGVCLSRAKRLYDNPSEQAIEKESLGTWSATYTTKADGLLDSEKYTLARYASWTNGY